MVKYTDMDKSLSVRGAAKMFFIPKSTLFDKLASNKEVKIGKKAHQPFSLQEKELVLWINSCMEKETN